MKIAQGDQVAPQPAVRHRGGDLQARVLLEGTPGTAGNFQLSLSATGEDFVSPRHRHNFEQYRFTVEGAFDFGADGEMTEGMVGYFPEGVYYGPQSSANDTLAAVLQFGGVSGNGYLSAQQVDDGMEALQEVGEFENGVFRRREGSGRKNQDAFEAIWEQVNGRRVAYPASSYTAPALLNPSQLAWVAMNGAAELAEKRLGLFGANRTGVRMLKLEHGARFEAAGRGVYLVLSGAGTVADEPLRALTAFYVEAGESASVRAREPVWVLHFELPVLFADGV
jgi:hypothetical protein